MKKLLIGLIGLIGLLGLLSVSALAGEIQNRKTGELIQFTADFHRSVLSIDSTVSGLGVRDITLVGYQAKKSEVKFYEYTRSICSEENDPQSNCIIFFTIIPIGYIPLAVETLIFPVQLSVKLIQNSEYKKDIKVLRKAISTDELVTVNNRRFERIVEILKETPKKTNRRYSL